MYISVTSSEALRGLRQAEAGQRGDEPWDPDVPRGPGAELSVPITSDCAVIVMPVIVISCDCDCDCCDCDACVSLCFSL